MSNVAIQELGYERTPLGELTLRRRFDVAVGREVFEVKLGDEYLMSSLFTEAERRLAVLGLEGLEGELDVVVGGLGLGYTAVEALKNERVRRLLVIDLFQPVIDWHREGLVPNGELLTNDARCELKQGDFFALARSGFDAGDPGRRFDAVMLDIDHSPEHFLEASNESFYSAEGLAAVRRQLKPGGRFAMWSDDRADDGFTEVLAGAFGSATGHDVEFPNPYTGGTSVNSVYVAIFSE
jgi:spermidine synthase